MADANAIANVGRTLIELLRAGMPDSVDSSDVELMSPADLKDQSKVRLTLHLYHVDENEHMRNTERPIESGAPNRAVDPLRLDLQYLLTAYPSDAQDETTNTADQHTVLGHAMQVLQENSVIPGSKLDGTFSDDEGVHVSVLPEPTDTMVNMWSTFDEEPYRPSVAYLVTPVTIETTSEGSVERVVDRTLVEHVSRGRVSDDE